MAAEDIDAAAESFDSFWNRYEGDSWRNAVHDRGLDPRQLDRRERLLLELAEARHRATINRIADRAN